MDKFLELLKELNLEQVNERLKQLDIEVRTMNEVVKIDEATEQKKALLERKDELENLEQRKQNALDLQSGTVAGKIIESRKGMNMENIIETRAKELVDKGSMTLNTKEVRSVVLSTGSLAKPTEVGGTNDPFNTVSSILDMVYVEDLTGCGSYKEAYVKSWQTADKGTDGTAPTPADPVFRTVAINPFLVDTLTYVSKNIKKQTPLAYEEKVRQGALIALKRKVVNLILKGNGSTDPFGIYNAVNTEDTPERMTQELLVSTNVIDEKTLRTIVFSYGGDENIGSGARLILNKKDLIKFGDVRGTSDKKAVYEIIPDGANPNIGIIKDGGLSVPYVISSDVTALSDSTKGAAKIPTMVYGAPGAYKLGLFGDYEVNVSADYKFAEGLLSVKGEVMVGGNVIVDKGFVVVTLDKTA